MKNAKLKKFVIVWLVFSLGIFLGELVLDEIFNFSRGFILVELLQSVFVGSFVAVLSYLFSIRRGL